MGRPLHRNHCRRCCVAGHERRRTRLPAGAGVHTPSPARCSLSTGASQNAGTSRDARPVVAEGSLAGGRRVVAVPVEADIRAEVEHRRPHLEAAQTIEGEPRALLTVHIAGREAVDAEVGIGSPAPDRPQTEEQGRSERRSAPWQGVQRARTVDRRSSSVSWVEWIRAIHATASPGYGVNRRLSRTTGVGVWFTLTATLKKQSLCAASNVV